MKYIYLVSLFLFSYAINAQNLLKSLYDIESNFPSEMKKAKKFIEESCSDCLIYDLMFGNSSQNYANYQFKIKSEKNLEFSLPYTDNCFVKFYDYRTKSPIKENIFYVDYAFEYLRHNNNFNLDKFFFSPKSYFKLATGITKYSGNDIAREIIFHLIKTDSFENKYPKYIKAIGEKYKFRKPISMAIIFEKTNHESFTIEDKIEKINQYIINQLDEDLDIVLFNTFLLDEKSEKDSFENLKKIFGEHTLKNVEDALQQKISINTNRTAHLKIPSKYLSFLNKEESFLAEVIEIRLDFKNKRVIIEFISEISTKMILKKAMSALKGIELSNVNLNAYTLQMIISESATKLIVEDKFNKMDVYEMLIEIP